MRRGTKASCCSADPASALPGFQTERGAPSTTQNGQFGAAVFVLFVCATFTCVPVRYVNKLALASFWWLLFSCAAICICIPVIAPPELRQNGQFVFATDTFKENAAINGLNDFANLGSQRNINAYTVCNGFLMAQVRRQQRDCCSQAGG